MARLKSNDGSVTLTPSTGTGDVTLSVSASQAVTTQSVTSGSAFQPNASGPCTLVIKDVVSVAQTGVTATLELGPTSTTVTAHKVDTATTLPHVAGLVYTRTLPVPAGWYVKFTLSSTTDATITASKFE